MSAEFDELDQMLGRRLRAARRLRKLTREALGTKTGRTKETIDAFEAGRESMDAEDIVTMADALKISTDYFLKPHQWRGD